MDKEARATDYVASISRLAELSPDALIVVDVEGQILVANHASGEVFGYPVSDLLELSVEDLVPQRLRRSHAEHLRRYRDDPRTRLMGEGKLDLYGLRKDGAEFPAEIALTAVRTEAGVITAAAIRDISERLAAERERADLVARLEREQLAAQASRMEGIGQLAGGIAHDFNNLITVVMGNVEFLTEQLTPNTPEHDEALEILSVTQRAAALTKRLRMFSRGDFIEPEPVDFNAIVASMEPLLRRTIGEQVDLITDLSPDLPLVSGDQSGLEQILLNLAANARDAMPAGGTLTISTKAIRGRTGSDGAGPLSAVGVQLSVTDTGVGMSSEVAARAFDPFFSTKQRTEGTGLGLATVYAIARELHGSVALESQEGLGTTMTVELPRMPLDED